MTWRDRPACLGENPELFFPIGNALVARRQIEKARVVCRRCEALEACLKWAMDSGQDCGVWGGLTEDERRALKRRNARTPDARADDNADLLPSLYVPVDRRDQATYRRKQQ